MASVGHPRQDSNVCQIDTPPNSALLSWENHPRADDKTRLLRYAIEAAPAAVVRVAARVVLDTDCSKSDADYKLARRFYANHPELFETYEMDGFIWVEPRPKALHLISSMHGAEKQDSDGAPVKLSKPKESPRERAKDVLSERQIIKSDAVRSLLLHSLATRREATEDAYVILEHKVKEDTYLANPWTTRFNAPQRVRDDAYQHAWDVAAGKYDTGVMLTLTTDPWRHESLLAATESFFEDIQALRNWLEYDPQTGPKRLGERVPTIVVPEFTDTGLIHAHVVFFDTTHVADTEELERYWSETRDRGEVLDIKHIRNPSGTWIWADRSEDCVQPRTYLGKMLNELVSFTQAHPSEIRETADALESGDDGDSSDNDSWWKLALYWATELQFFTASPCLKPDSYDGPNYKTDWWSFVGVMEGKKIPRNIRENLVTSLDGPNRHPPPPDKPG